jgi:glycine cleavage system transcriptional repressor
MKAHALLSALGRDRVGVADDLAAALANRRIDIEDSRMTALRGQFALIVHVCGEKDSVASLHQDLSALGANLGFHLALDPIEPPRPSTRVEKFVIESFSRGPSGIRAVTGILKRHQINIEDLETDASSASWTSAITFHMKARITIPSSCSVARLEQELRELERERPRLDIVIKPVPSMAKEDSSFQTV